MKNCGGSGGWKEVLPPEEGVTGVTEKVFPPEDGASGVTAAVSSGDEGPHPVVPLIRSDAPFITPDIMSVALSTWDAVGMSIFIGDDGVSTIVVVPSAGVFDDVESVDEEAESLVETAASLDSGALSLLDGAGAEPWAMQ